MHRGQRVGRTGSLRSLVVLSLVSIVSGCGGAASDGLAATAFQGARVIVGDGSAPIEDATIVVEGDRLVAVGPTASVDVPTGATVVDLAGKTVMPAVVNAHVHLPSERAERVDLLQHMAYYGTSAALSLGLDEGEVGLAMRDDVIPDGARSQSAGRGITTPEPGRTEVPYWVTSEEEARESVRELAGQDVDIVKIWVDDRGGQYERLSPALYSAVIDEAHAHDLRVAAHIFRLEDAKGLLRAGVDAFAHGIRDMDVDDELVELWLERPEVVLIPNLPPPGVAEDLSWLSGTVPAEELAQLQERSVDRPAAQEAFGIQARNLRRLSEAGVKIAFGTDGSSPWAVHQEMADMVRAGMTPADVITAATGTAAEFMRMGDIGTLEAGKSADFVVLDANPLDDITNTHRISAVYLRGDEVDREALGARFRGEASGG